MLHLPARTALRTARRVVASAPLRTFFSSAPTPPPQAPSSSSHTTNTIAPDEIAHFSKLSAHWWDPTGEFALLHRMNPARIQFMRETLLRERELEGARWLESKDVLDVGCGGGIFAEAISRLGARTLAIDASPANITVAQTHASLDPSFIVAASPIPPRSTAAPSASSSVGKNALEYRHCAAEDLVQEGKQFDIVCAMEVIEHVEDPRGFLDCLCELTKPGAPLLLSTISRTPLASFLTLTLAEDVLRLVTPGTHTYSKFIKPEELQGYFEEKGWTHMERRGCIYDPIKGGWRLLGMGEWGGMGELVNYFFSARKPLA